jgi:hypothetical protein
MAAQQDNKTNGKGGKVALITFLPSFRHILYQRAFR